MHCPYRHRLDRGNKKLSQKYYHKYFIIGIITFKTTMFHKSSSLKKDHSEKFGIIGLFFLSRFCLILLILYTDKLILAITGQFL